MSQKKANKSKDKKTSVNASDKKEITKGKKADIKSKENPVKKKSKVGEYVSEESNSDDEKESIEEKALEKNLDKKKLIPKGNQAKVKKSKGNIDHDNIMLEVKTIQTPAFKQFVERIQNVITEVVWVFLPPDEEEENDVDDYYKSEEEDNDDDNSNDDNSDDDMGNKQKRKKKNNSEEDAKHKKKKKTEKFSTKEKNGAKNKDKEKKNSGGIRILRLTEDRNTLIKLILHANKFEYFRCTEPKIKVGVDMSQLHTMLKSVSDNDPITLYMNKGCRDILYIHSDTGDSGHTEETDLEIPLLDIENQEVPLPKAKFQNKITMAADKFHLICKQLSNTSDTVEIISVDNEIGFKGNSDGAKTSKTYKDTHNKKKKNTEIVQGIYDLRHLLYFSKCNKLCPTVDIYLKNDFPLVLSIHVGTLGKMYVFLTPSDPT